MKITTIETIQVAEFANILFLRIHTDSGITGLGETFFSPATVAAHIHETLAPKLLGRDPLEIAAIHLDLTDYVGFHGSGAEMRARSAIDIALWDVLGKVTGLPLYQLLGGKTKDALRVYNTCAGYRYIRTSTGQKVSNWGVGSDAEGPYEDLDGFLHHPVDLAKSLLAEGITAMKIWPFDAYAEASHGHHLSLADLNRGLEPFERIRDALGDEMELILELHGLWDVPMAQRIAAAMEPIRPLWIEDPVRADQVSALAEVARSTSIPIAVSETISTANAFREYLLRDAAGILMADLSWVGGITEAQKIAALADSAGKPVLFHDCTGPVVYAASTHLSMHHPHAFVQESVRAFWSGWYTELVTAVPPIEDGHIRPLSGPGIGTELRPEVLDRPDATIRTSGL